MKLLSQDALWLQTLRRYLVSGWGMAAQACLAAIVIVFDIKIPGIALFAALICTILVLCDNILATTPPALFMTLFLIKSNTSTAYADYSKLWWIALLPLGALLFHLFRYRKPLRRGKAFWPLAAVTVVLLLGGVGSISAEEYFAGTSLYHMLALGLGMLIAYLWLSSAVEQDKQGELPEFVANMMITMGLLACFMIFHHYISFIPQLIKAPAILPFQWRNNVSTYLMLALPFPFYKSFRRPSWLLCGLLMYLGLLLSGSRGGMLFGSIELLMCVLFVLFADKKRRLVYLGIGALLLVAVIICIPFVLPFFKPTLLRLFNSIFNGEEEVRSGLYQRAIEDFLAHPLLGTGLGYMGNRDIHPSKPFALCWYHCAPLQILGSFGVAGILGYGWMYITRLRVFLARRSKFHLTLFLAWVGIEMMSLVNPGVFAPLPYLMLVTMFMVFAEKTEDSSFS